MEATGNMGISPFSMQKSYRVIWGKEENPPSHMKVKLNDAQKLSLRRLATLKVCTTNQLAKQLHRQLRKGKDLVNDLRKKGLIVPHLLEEETTGARIPFYSLSPTYAGKIGLDAISKPLVAQEILKKMLLSQLFVRFLEVDPQVEVLPFPNPFDGALHILGNDFRVGVIRGNVGAIQNHFLYHQEQMKTLLVVERLLEADQLNSIYTPLIRVTTDYHLLKGELATSFHKLSDGVWKQVSIPIFKKSG